MGNGDEASGDGFLFRGRGILQLTGRSNYASASKEMGVDLLKNPDLLLQPQHAALSAAWFWAKNGLNELADDNTDDNDKEDFTKITKAINGGTQGFDARFALLKAVEGAMA